MILLHILDDFVLQPICLSKLKQKDWWKKNAPDSLYRNDYRAGLLMHALSWAVMINLPLIWFDSISDISLGISVFINGAIHYIVDDLKANKHKINLQQDQSIHVIQIFITCLIFTICI